MEEKRSVKQGKSTIITPDYYLENYNDKDLDLKAVEELKKCLNTWLNKKLPNIWFHGDYQKYQMRKYKRVLEVMKQNGH